MNASIVIPTYQRHNSALKLGIQCKTYERKAEVIIVDSSPQISQSIIQSAKKNHIVYLPILENETENAKNIGWKKAKGDIIIFFDDDVKIHKNTIKEHMITYENNLNTIGVAGRVVNVKEPIPQETDVETGRMNNLATNFSMNFWSAKKQDVDFVYGCNMSFKKDILEKVDGCKPAYSFEEIDLSLKAKKYGRIVFNPNALVTHFQFPSGGTRIHKEKYELHYWKNWGSLVRTHVPFPLSLISLGILSYRALKKHYQYVQKLYEGFFE